MRRHHRLLVAPALALAATTLVACGGDDDPAEGTDEGGFCDRVEALNESFDSIDSDEASLDDLQSAVDSLETTADEAPDDLSGSFDTAVEALQGFVDGLAEYDIDPSAPFQQEFEPILQDDPEAIDEVNALVTELDDATESITSIEEGVLEECDIDLNEGEGGGASDSEGSGGGGGE